MRKPAILILTVLALSACGNDPNRTDPFQLAGMMQQDAPQPKVTRQQMAEAALAQLSEPVMLAVLESDRRTALLVPLGENGSARTWTTIDRQTITLRAGRAIATRGLGADLMSSTADRPGGTARHSLTTLNAANEPVRMVQNCQPSVAVRDRLVLSSGEGLDATHLSETCQSGVGTVTNEFWIAPDGQTRKSRQWIGAMSGYLTLEVLRP